MYGIRVCKTTNRAGSSFVAAPLFVVRSKIGTLV